MMPGHANKKACTLLPGRAKRAKHKHCFQG